jgi:hypothetical protein
LHDLIELYDSYDLESTGEIFVTDRRVRVFDAIVDVVGVQDDEG